MKNVTAYPMNIEYKAKGASAFGTYTLGDQGEQEFGSEMGALYLLHSDDPKEKQLFFGVTFTLEDFANKTKLLVSLAFKMPRLITVNEKHDFPGGPVHIEAFLMDPSANKPQQLAIDGHLTCLERDDNRAVARVFCKFKASTWSPAVTFDLFHITAFR